MDSSSAPNSNGTDSGAVNPFEAPTVLSEEPQLIQQAGTKPVPPLGKLFAKWGFVCAVSATPSFIVAMGFEAGVVPKVTGMFAGVALFILLYVFAERTRQIQALLDQPVVRTTAWIGYGTRIFITIVFPIGFSIDMFCGLMSVSISQGLTGMVFGFEGSVPDGQATGLLATFGWYFFTTAIQGVVLNMVLFAYMLLVWMIGFSIVYLSKKSTGASADRL